jgi:hypothetical protein
MEPTPAAPAKKSNTPMIIAVVVAAVLSLCCCLPGIINLISPLPVTSTTEFFGESTTSTGTLPAWSGVFCLCAALIPWLAVLIVALVRRPKK